MLDKLQYRLLRAIAPREPNITETAYPVGKVRAIFGPEVFHLARGKTVVDFGCGLGHEVVELAKAGAGRVIGIDSREHVLEEARGYAASRDVNGTCVFCTESSEQADLMISIDSFEHFPDPADTLHKMREMLKPRGTLLISFGWPWYHPLGGHLFSVFPWAHLLFSEKALCRWRSHIRSDGATRFSEVDGGLNKMTIRRFVEIVLRSGFSVDFLRLIPIRKLKRLHSRWTREFTTAVIQCRLIKG